MGVLEQLGPFVYFGQLTGLLPYRIKFNPFTGRFKDFTFSWCDRITFWFVLNIGFQFLPLVVLVWLFMVAQLYESSTFTNLPLPLILLYGIIVVNHYLMIILSRIIMFRFKKLSIAINSLIDDTVRYLEELESLPHCQNSTKKRTIVGILLILASVRNNSTLFYF